MQNVGIFPLLFLFFFLLPLPQPLPFESKHQKQFASSSRSSSSCLYLLLLRWGGFVLSGKKSDLMWSNWLAIATAQLCLLSHRLLSDTSPAFIIFMYMHMSPRPLACRWRGCRTQRAELRADARADPLTDTVNSIYHPTTLNEVFRRL